MKQSVLEDKSVPQLRYRAICILKVTYAMSPRLSTQTQPLLRATEPPAEFSLCSGCSAGGVRRASLALEVLSAWLGMPLLCLAMEQSQAHML